MLIFLGFVIGWQVESNFFCTIGIPRTDLCGMPDIEEGKTGISPIDFVQMKSLWINTRVNNLIQALKILHTPLILTPNLMMQIICFLIFLDIGNLLGNDLPCSAQIRYH